MDRAYHQKWFHLKGMLFPGLIFALIPAGIVGLIVMLMQSSTVRRHMPAMRTVQRKRDAR